MSPRRVALVLLAPLALACADSTQPSYVDAVRLNPEYAGIAVGETMILEAIPIGRNDEPLRDRAERVQFRAANPSIISIEPMGDGRVQVTGLQLGSTFVEGTLGRGSGSTLMFVQPPGLDRIRIEPNTVTTSFPGFVQLRATLLDASGNQISDHGFTYKWTTSNVNVADFIYDYTNPLGVRARGPGTATITLRVGSKTATATVIVQ